MKAFASLLAVLVMLSSTSLAQTAPATAQEAAPAASSTSTEVNAVPVAPLVPGVKLFLEPMDGFEQFLSEAFLKKKVPVVVVTERDKADFLVSGETHLKKPGWITGNVLPAHGKGNIVIVDAHTGGIVFTHKFTRVDQMVAEYYVYQGWADGCAKDLKKVMVKKK